MIKTINGTDKFIYDTWGDENNMKSYLNPFIWNCHC